MAGSDRKSKEMKKSSRTISSDPEDEGKRKRSRTEDSEERHSRKRHLKEKKSRRHSKRRSDKEKKSKDKHKGRPDKDGHHSKHDVQDLSNDDYFSKNNEFATWLKEEKNVYFSDLSSEAARGMFSDFVTAWNNKKLESRYYEGIASGPRTAHNWKIKP